MRSMLWMLLLGSVLVLTGCDDSDSAETPWGVKCNATNYNTVCTAAGSCEFNGKDATSGTCVPLIECSDDTVCDGRSCGENPVDGKSYCGFTASSFGIIAPTFSTGRVGIAYKDVTITTVGAAGDVHFVLAEGSTLPTGLTFDNGVISGTPTETGQFKFSVIAYNGAVDATIFYNMISVTEDYEITVTNGAYIDPCNNNPCTESNKTVCTDLDADEVAECGCDDYYHDEDGSCVADTKTVSCKDVVALPENSEQITEDVVLIWNETDGWPEIATCEWSCNDGFRKDGESCISYTDPCGDINPCTEANRTKCSDDDFDQVAECSCDSGYHLEETSCIANTKEVTCKDIETLPEHSMQITKDVTIKWKESTGWADPLECRWSCNENFKEVDDGCIADPCALVNPCITINQTICSDDDDDGIAECGCDVGYEINGDLCELIVVAQTLFISEYVEGSGNNKAIELFNPLDSSVDLSEYEIAIAINAKNWNERKLKLTGMLKSHESYVICNTAMEDKTKCDLLTDTSMTFNGNDAIGLRHNNRYIDIIGVPESDSSHDVAGVENATQNHTLVRKTSIVGGTSNWLFSAGKTAENSQWIVKEIDDLSDLGGYAVCGDGESQQQSCDIFNESLNGSQNRYCGLNGQWGEWGACVDPDICSNDETRNIDCGLNDTGSQAQICTDGQWADSGECSGADTCSAEETESKSCDVLNTNLNGVQSRSCVDGQWGVWSFCDDPDECVIDASDTQGCDILNDNNNGTQNRTCNDSGQWGSWDTCDDPDVCTDDETENTTVCGNGIQPEICVDGQWENNGVCSCDTGYTGAGCDQDVDECATDTDNCIASEYCSNSVGSFSCTVCGCDTMGTTGNIDSCSDETGQCNCEMGYVGVKCDSCDVGYQDNDENGSCEVARAFLTTWKTDNVGTSDDTQITIPTNSSEYTYSYNIDCDNDGTLEATGVTGDYTCNYDVAGTYQVAILGTFPQIYFNIKGDRAKIISIDQWGTIQWESMKSAFGGCTNLTGVATDAPDLSNVTDMSEMFAYASVFNQDISGWDVSHIVNMSKMFNYATLFNQPLNSWNVSSVTDMSGLFKSAAAFDQPLNNWDVHSVTDMGEMFSSTSFNQSLNSWNVGAVTNMQGLFASSAFNEDISDWDVSHVTNMNRLFYIAMAFNQDISEWKVGRVTDMGSMFYSAHAFNQDISGWDVSKVIMMESMFVDASSFDQPIGNWDVSGVKNMGLMFRSATVFNQDLSGWKVGSVTEYDYFDLDTPAWSTFRPPFAAYLFLTTWKTDNVGTSGTAQATIPTNSDYTYNYNVDCDNDGIFEKIGATGDYTCSYDTPGEYQIAIYGDFPQIYFNNGGDKDKILSIDQWGTIQWQSMKSAFYGCSNLTGDATDTPDLSNVTDLSNMFASATLFDGDISGWDVSNVTNMSYMFFYARAFDQNIGNWVVSEVTNMEAMFYYATSFNQSIGGWTVSNVTNMKEMFFAAFVFNQNLSSWIVAQVTEYVDFDKYANAWTFSRPNFQ